MITVKAVIVFDEEEGLLVLNGISKNVVII